MLFQKKVDRSFKHLNEDGEKRGLTLKEAKGQNSEEKLEKGDVPAMILSALLVFGPILLVLGVILFLLLWL